MDKAGDNVSQHDLEIAQTVARLEVKVDMLSVQIDSTVGARLEHLEDRITKMERQSLYMTGWVAGVACVVSALVTWFQRYF
ncbi:MAG: hypothetical protein [Bacteriophage sp.]|nr:MAG: hypothetical protein [Bacteriophage sp.]